MPEEILFASESSQDCADVASYIRTIADRLERGEEITLSEGDEEITLQLPDMATFEVTVEREQIADESGELSLELELGWPEDASGEDSDGIAIE